MFGDRDVALLNEIQGYLQSVKDKDESVLAEQKALTGKIDEILLMLGTAVLGYETSQLMLIGHVSSPVQMLEESQRVVQRVIVDNRLKSTLSDDLLALLEFGIQKYNTCEKSDRVEVKSFLEKIKNYIFSLWGIEDNEDILELPKKKEKYNAKEILKKLRNLINLQQETSDKNTDQKEDGVSKLAQQGADFNDLSAKLKSLGASIDNMLPVNDKTTKVQKDAVSEFKKNLEEALQPPAADQLTILGMPGKIIGYLANKFCDDLDKLTPFLNNTQRTDLVTLISSYQWPMPDSLLPFQPSIANAVDLAFLFDYYRITIDPTLYKKIGITELLKKHESANKKFIFNRDYYHHLGFDNSGEKITEVQVSAKYRKITDLILSNYFSLPIREIIATARMPGNAKRAHEVLKVEELRAAYDRENQKAREIEKVKQIANLPEDLLIAFLHLAIETNNENLFTDICKRFEVSAESKQEAGAMPNKAGSTLKERVILVVDAQGENALHKAHRLKRAAMRVELLKGVGIVVGAQALVQADTQGNTQLAYTKDPQGSKTAGPDVLYNEAGLTKQDRAELQKFCVSIKSLLDLDVKLQEDQYGIAVPTVQGRKKEERTSFIKALQEFYDAMNPIVTYQTEIKQEDPYGVEKRVGDALLNLLEKVIGYCNNRSKSENREKINSKIIVEIEKLIINLQGFRASEKCLQGYPAAFAKLDDALDKKLKDKKSFISFARMDETLKNRQEEIQRKKVEKTNKERTRFVALFTALQQIISAVDELQDTAKLAEVNAFKANVSKLQLADVNDDTQPFGVATEVLNYVMTGFKKDINAIRQKLAVQKQGQLDKLVAAENMAKLYGEDELVTLLHFAVQQSNEPLCMAICSNFDAKPEAEQQSQKASVISATDENGQNVLHKAFRVGNKTICELLLKGLDPTAIAKAALARDKDHNTPFDYTQDETIRGFVRPHLVHDNPGCSDQDKVMLTDFYNYIIKFFDAMQEQNKDNLQKIVEQQDSATRIISAVKYLINKYRRTLQQGMSADHGGELIATSLLVLHKTFTAFYSYAKDPSEIKNIVARIEYLIINLQGFKLPSRHVKQHDNLAKYDFEDDQIKEIKSDEKIREEEIPAKQIDDVFQQREKRIGSPTKARHEHLSAQAQQEFLDKEYTSLSEKMKQVRAMVNNRVGTKQLAAVGIFERNVTAALDTSYEKSGINFGKPTKIITYLTTLQFEKDIAEIVEELGDESAAKLEQDVKNLMKPTLVDFEDVWIVDNILSEDQSSHIPVLLNMLDPHKAYFFLKRDELKIKDKEALQQTVIASMKAQGISVELMNMCCDSCLGNDEAAKERNLDALCKLIDGVLLGKTQAAGAPTLEQAIKFLKFIKMEAAMERSSKFRDVWLRLSVSYTNYQAMAKVPKVVAELSAKLKESELRNALLGPYEEKDGDEIKLTKILIYLHKDKIFSAARIAPLEYLMIIFHQAIQRNDVQLFDSICTALEAEEGLKKEVVSIVDAHGQNAWHKACQQGNPAIARRLLKDLVPDEYLFAIDSIRSQRAIGYAENSELISVIIQGIADPQHAYVRIYSEKNNIPSSSALLKALRPYIGDQKDDKNKVYLEELYVGYLNGYTQGDDIKKQALFFAFYAKLNDEIYNGEVFRWGKFCFSLAEIDSFNRFINRLPSLQRAAFLRDAYSYEEAKRNRLQAFERRKINLKSPLLPLPVKTDLRKVAYDATEGELIQFVLTQFAIFQNTINPIKLKDFIDWAIAYESKEDAAPGENNKTIYARRCQRIMKILLTDVKDGKSGNSGLLLSMFSGVASVVLPGFSRLLEILPDDDVYKILTTKYQPGFGKEGDILFHFIMKTGSFFSEDLENLPDVVSRIALERIGIKRALMLSPELLLKRTDNDAWFLREYRQINSPNFNFQLLRLYCYSCKFRDKGGIEAFSRMLCASYSGLPLETPDNSKWRYQTGGETFFELQNVMIQTPPTRDHLIEFIESLQAVKDFQPFAKSLWEFKCQVGGKTHSVEEGYKAIQAAKLASATGAQVPADEKSNAPTPDSTKMKDGSSLVPALSSLSLVSSGSKGSASSTSSAVTASTSTASATSTTSSTSSASSQPPSSTPSIPPPG